jgi:hypothetical protein
MSVLSLSGVNSTSNAASYTTASATPTANDLLVFLGGVDGNTASDWAVSDSLGGTWTKIRRELYTSSADILECWVRNSLASASALTVTFSHASGNATGSNFRVVRVTGMSRTGSSAVLQQAGQSNQAAGTPAPAFGVSALTANPCVGAVANATNPATMTPPASPWAEGATGGDVGHSTPTRGFEWAFSDTTFTGTTVTWGSASASAFGSLIIELDRSAAASGSLLVPSHFQHLRNR